MATIANEACGVGFAGLHEPFNMSPVVFVAITHVQGFQIFKDMNSKYTKTVVFYVLLGSWPGSGQGPQMRIGRAEPGRSIYIVYIYIYNLLLFEGVCLRTHVILIWCAVYNLA